MLSNTCCHLRYESAEAIKGQVMADFVTHHYAPDVTPAPLQLSDNDPTNALTPPSDLSV